MSNKKIDLNYFNLDKKILQNINFFKFDEVNLIKIYKKSDILVSTSLYEGFPNVIAEAINYNCLIISAKNFGGARQLIGNGDKGIYYKLNNPQDLSEKIEFTLRNKKLIKEKILKSKKNLIKLSKLHNTVIKIYLIEYKNEKKNEKILFSIITVSLNQPKIKNNFKSLRKQTYKNFEHIVIDGGSTDKTVDIIKKNSKNISFWQSKKDKGIYDAINIGIKKSKGDIIGILNADDIYYKNALEIVKKYFENERIDFLFGTVRKERVMQGFWPNKIRWKFNIYPSHSGGFFITRLAQKKIGYYNLKFKYSSDRDLIYRMIVRHKLSGGCTKKNEIISKFDTGGISSKISFFERLFEEARIRLNNNQNIFFVFLLIIAHTINKFLNLIIKR